MHALKDGWDKSDVTWLLRGQTSDTVFAIQEIAVRVCIFLTTENEQLFILKTIMENKGWKSSLLLF